MKKAIMFLTISALISIALLSLLCGCAQAQSSSCQTTVSSAQSTSSVATTAQSDEQTTTQAQQSQDNSQSNAAQNSAVEIDFEELDQDYDLN
jgi:hypothetical protein